MKRILTYIITFILNRKIKGVKVKYSSTIFSLFLTFLEYYLKGDQELLAIQHKTIGVRLKLHK